MEIREGRGVGMTIFSFLGLSQQPDFLFLIVS